MQTQSIKNQSTNPLQPPKSAPLPSSDFKNALTLEIERMPVCAAPEQPAPAASQSKAPVKNAQAAKPAQQANRPQEAGRADQADSAASASEAADARPATAAQPSGENDSADEADDSAVADPAAGMLAMLAAYGQLTAKAELATDSGSATADLATDAAALAALQADAAGKATLADLAARARGTDGSSTSALQDALSEQGGAGRMPNGGTGLALGADQKAQAFAARLAESAAETLAATLADAAPAAQPVAAPAAQALAATMQAANAVAASQLQARVGTNVWEQQLGQKVVWMVAGGDQSASLTLNPPDLGPLQVVLNVSNDSATATFTAHQPETRQAIENALPKLREMMGEAGIVLGDASVSAGSQEQQQAFAEQAARNGGGRYGNGGNGGDGGDAAAPEDGQPVIRRTVLGAVDTFA
ncbi:flagellar hook-length control protein FliK [Pseudoduganella umbonata]|uniref:Flagellar hook-length control protein FliK n=1 Tax=Pseudoduganella umbonata TaxID=864828 RepID=A0A4V1EDK7_9BURK|nr:flagellar hook-length control protein FliK [Pseudoduganella umbonata]MBB3225110.1 flagellar hook-length control protein FliK [Pseudoduganella umbonata]QCP11421.1 flagellar hook-length control protein FliK [Pseudoduganella umbonata]